jgi:ubiquinone/menaquinone biosynthesis C-methylase UbiE
MTRKPIAAGKSSFELIDAEGLFAALKLPEDTVLLDLACGRGAYALAASTYIGQRGRIYAFDLWAEGIAALQADAAAGRLEQIQAQVTDVSQPLPLEDHCVDVCLMATVLHDLVQERTDQTALQEVRRVLKNKGTLAVVEFKKIEGPPGPPVAIRLSREECRERLRSLGFDFVRHLDVGPYHYLACFTK